MRSRLGFLRNVARLATQRTALWLGLLTLAVTIVAVVIAALDGSVSAGGGTALFLVPGFGLVGAVVARRQPRNPIGWSMLGAALFIAVSGLASTYSVLDYRHHHGNLALGPVAVVLQPGWAPAIILFALSILLFPDGHLPSGKWRVPLVALVAAAAVWLAGAYALAADVIVAHDVRIDSTGNLVQGDHPTGNWAWWAVSQTVFFVILACVGVAWLVGQIPAYRRATGVRRAQLKWVLLGAGTALVGGMLSVTQSSSGISFVLGVVGTIGLLGLPIGIGIGITRYRLYEIDRLISRTLSYALLTGLLIGVFVGLVLLTTRVLPFSSPVGVAASTLAALALFNPLRGRIQRVVDRRFNRARYDAETTVTAFAARLRNAVDVDTVLDELAAAAGASLEPSHVSVWIKP
jgi:MFS family permease